MMKHKHAFARKLLFISIILLVISSAISVAQAADTGFRSPTANAVFSNGGFTTTPEGAHVDGGAFASRDNAPNGAAQLYRDYGFTIPADAAIQGIEVRLDWWMLNTQGNNEIRVYLSGDGGTTWSDFDESNNESTNTNNTDTIGNDNDTWGRRWLPSEFSNANFRVRVELRSDRTDRTFRLDWVPVRVTYTTPQPAPSMPTLIEPINGGEVSSGTVTLYWNASTDPYGDPITYDVSIDGGAFVSAGAATQYTPGTTFANGSNHTWRVQACDDRGACSTPSATWSFTINTDIGSGPNQDAYINQSTSDNPDQAATNYGTNQYLYVRSDTSNGAPANRRAFVRFDLPTITSCYPDTSPSIVQATLRLYSEAGPSALRTYQLFRVNAAWNEVNPSGITWNNQPNIAPIPTASTNVSINYTGWVEWNVTSDLQSFIDYGGINTNYGWVVKESDETQVSGSFETRFLSKDHVGTSADPQLRITYNCPPAAPVLISPANGSYLADNTPLLDWNPATDPNVGDTLTYAVRVSTSGIWGAWNTSPGTATQFTTPVLSEGFHEWQVRVSDGRSEAFSDIWGFTIDTDTPATPAFLSEGNPDQDFYSSTNYSLLINWGSVAETGSGISYRLERRVNGGAFTLVTTTTTTSFLDTGTFVNNDLLEYRVRAQTGASIAGAFQTSDGVRIDAQTLPQVTGVGEGAVVGTDDDWSRNNVYFVYWNLVTSTGSPISYEVQRIVNGGTPETFTPAGQTCDAVRCWGDDLVAHANGDEIHYRVRVVNTAGSQGAYSAESDGITIDTIVPDSGVTTGGLFGPGTWPGSITGVASDPGSGVARVDISIFDSTATNLYWNGTAWVVSLTPIFVQATGTTAWSYAFPAVNLTDGHTYVVNSRATDIATNVETVLGTNNFTYSGSLPAAPVPTSPTHVSPTTWYNNNHPTFQWNVPAGGVIDGYSFILDQVDGTIPDTTSEGNVTTYDPGNKTDGTWYFHVRAHNAAGWGPPGQVRVNIDTTAPLTSASITEENPDIDLHVGGNVTVYWTAVSDASPVTYSLEHCVNGGLTGTCTSGWAPLVSGLTETQYEDTIGITDGTTVRYRVHATDSVPLTGGFRESDGLTIDSQIPATSAGVFEDTTSEPDRDWHNSAAGAVTVRWSSVANTGSGITYRLEKELNDSGIWTLVTSGLAATSIADSGAYGDGDKITYRVTAINGVGSEGTPRESDGFTIDTGVPARSDWVREENPDVDFDDDGTFTVFWNAVASTGSPISYKLESSVDGGTIWTLVADNLSGTSQNVAESDPDGTTILYRITASNSAGTSGPARQSDGITLDRDTPSAPASVTENSPDVDFDDDGALQVFWTAVLNTGSGITYELQKQVTPPGGPVGPWNTIANNLLTTNYNDPATFPDETFIQYRVIAHNGVGRFSAPTQSDGVRVDTNVPGTPTNVGEGDVAGTDDDYDQDNTFFVYWTGVTQTASGDQISYTVERNVNGGGWVTAASLLPCGGTPCQWEDPAAFSNGDIIQYRVTAVNGAGRTSVTSLVSDGIRIDTTQPDSTVTTSGFYTGFTWPGSVVGAASDTGGSGVAFVDIQIRRSDNQYWDGATWGATPTWLRTDGRDNWEYALNVAALTDGQTYNVSSRATDQAGNVEAVFGTNSFTFSNSGPDVPVVSSTTHPVETNWYNNNNPVLNWTTPAGGGGLLVTGYSYILDQNPSTLPDTTVDTTGNTASYTGLADGTWYFHVRAVNSANNWGPAAHFRFNIDRDTPAAPASITEENPDVDLDADGSVTVFWSPVTDTGSGITYRLERNLNGTGFVLVPGADALTTTSFTVGGFANGDNIVFRVRATNGVALSSAYTTSDGVTIDTNVPGTPTNVGEGDVVGTDDDWDQDNAFFVYWTAVPAVPSGISYTIERSQNGGLFQVVATNITSTSWDDPTAYATGTSVAYRITAVTGAGRSSAASTPSDGLTLDFALPDSLVTTNGFFNSFNWPGSIVGTSTDVGSDVAFVDIQIQRTDNNQYWNGTTWGVPATFVRATGTHNWQYPLALANLTDGVTYNLTSRATDIASNIEITLGTNTFTFSGTGPGAPTVSSTTHPVQTNWYNNNAPALSWTTPAGGVAIVGYSYILDQLPSTTPDQSPDGTGTTTSYTGLADGTWYFHVRAVDSANNWGPAAHFRFNIDRDTPAAPASITEENPDVDLDADGNLTVFWSPVTDTGSGITYRLEQQINGGAFTLVISTTSTSQAITGLTNGQTAVYRVRATNGVGLTSAYTTSDGVTIDTSTPGTPTNVGEGDVVGTDDDWDQDNAFFVYWTAVPNIPAGISYLIERSRNGGPFEVVATNITSTSWDDPTAYATGESVAYRVKAVSGAGSAGSASTPSDGLALDFVRPDSVVATGGSYNAITWPGFIEGTATDDLSDVAFVDITLRRRSDNFYWNGTTWDPALTWLRTTGIANWQYTFAPDDGITYDVQSRATDIAGNVETTFGANNFTYVNNELSINLADNRDTVQPGERITYTITFSGAHALLPGVVEIGIPANTTRVGASPGFVDNGTSIAWTVLQAAGAIGQRYLVVELPPVLDNGTVISTTATIGANSQSNQDSESALVVSQPNLANSIKSVSDPNADPGDLVTYQIVLTNTGNMHAYTTTVTDVLPAEVVYQGNLAASSGTPSFNAGQVGWQGEVQVGTPVVISFTAQVSDSLNIGTVVENIANINDGVKSTFERSAVISVGNPAPRIGPVFLPLIMNGVSVTTPTGPEIELTIRNCGDANAVGAFWIDLYVNPNEQSSFWPISHGEGYDWFGQGAGFVLSTLGPGQSKSFYLSEASLKNLPNPLPASLKLYAQVDLFDKTTPGLGVVDEGSGGETNNVAGNSGSTCNATPGKADLIIQSIKYISGSTAQSAATVEQVEGAEPAPARVQPPQQ